MRELASNRHRDANVGEDQLTIDSVTWTSTSVDLIPKNLIESAFVLNPNIDDHCDFRITQSIVF